jgi:hypothetical protein
LLVVLAALHTPLPPIDMIQKTDTFAILAFPKLKVPLLAITHIAETGDSATRTRKLTQGTESNSCSMRFQLVLMA